jgi:hypothetical protein
MFRHASRLALMGAALTLFAAPAAAEAATGAQIRASVDAGADWLDGQQLSAGNWSGFGANQVPSALAAAGRNGADVSQPGGTSAQDYLHSTLTGPTFTAPTSASDSATRVGILQQSVLQGYAAGLDPNRIAANQNLAAQLAGYYAGGFFAAQPQPGDADARSTNFAVFGGLALTRLGAPRFLLDRTAGAIRSSQHTDGGWDFPYVSGDADRAGASSIDLTGAALAALCESGADSRDADVREGVAFLKGKLIATGGTAGSEGGFETGFGADADSTGWAVTGLNACAIDPQGPDFQGANGQTPVDYLISLQVTAGADAGAFTLNYGDVYGLGPNVGASQDALRALAGGSFVVEPPARANPADPRRRPAPAVADGTSVPVALAVDDGSGGVTFCRVTIPSGASLARLLATANGSSAPAGCATGGQFTAGQVSSLNGQTGTWAFSVNGGAEQIAGGQSVRFGDLVALRRTSGAVPAAPAGGSAQQPVAAAQQARTVPAGVSSRSLKVSARKRVVSVPLSCAKANRLCQGTVYLVYGKRTLGRRAFLIGGGKTTKLNVKLYRSGVKQLRGKRRKVKVNVFSRDAAGMASNSTRTVTLTPTR